LDDRDLVAGDRFHLHLVLHNPEQADFAADAYVLLGVHGDFWSWPSWIPLEDGVDYQAVFCGAMTAQPMTLLDFSWPAGAGTAAGLEFYGALFEPSSFNMIGNLAYIEWEFR